MSLPIKGLSAALLCAVGAATAAYGDNPSVPSAAAVDTASGAETYSQICQGCHMAAAQGAVGAGHYPKLAGDPALVSWQYVALTVINGKKAMPAFGVPVNPVMEFGAVRLSDARIADVVNYVRSHFGNKWKDKVTAGQVAALPHPP
jgi:mono/diheme cytochrome c family protein